MTEKQVIHDPADYTESSTAWNDPGSLAPVGSNIMIQVPAGLTIGDTDWAVVIKQDAVYQVKRTDHISEKGREMRYAVLGGGFITGRFRWTHA